MLAASGMRTAFRLITQAASHGRSIHIPSNALGRKPPLPPVKGQGVFDTARNAFTRLLYGTGTGAAPKPQAFRRAIHTVQPIRNQFSYPVRHALSNSPLNFARPPIVQRKITDVGLGTARKFSTARPIFQHLVQNVPVVGRSVYEMDLDLEKKKARRLIAKKLGQEGKPMKTQEKTKRRRSLEESFDRYFSTEPTAEEISAILTVPLTPFDAPTTSPSPSNKQARHTFLPLHDMSQSFRSHGDHSLRISNLFRRLDQAKVWDRGAHYEAFGSVPVLTESWTPGSALCTSLRIVFDGWSAEMVRSVIGEAGQDWCTLKESVTRTDKPIGPKSLDSSRAPTPENVWATSPELAMPSIDFSSAFLDQTEIYSPSSQHLQFEDTAIIGSGPSTPWMSDSMSLPSTRSGSVFGDYEVEDEWQQDLSALPNTTRGTIHAEGTMPFSADFMRRSRDMDVWSNF